METTHFSKRNFDWVNYRCNISGSETLVATRGLNITQVNNSWHEIEMLFTVLPLSKPYPSQATSEAHTHIYAHTDTHTHNQKSVWLWHYDPNTKVIDCKIEPRLWLCWEWIFHEFIFHGVSAALNEMLFSVMWLTASCSVSRLHCSSQIETLWDSNTNLTAAGNIYKKYAGQSGWSALLSQDEIS